MIRFLLLIFCFSFSCHSIKQFDYSNFLELEKVYNRGKVLKEQKKYEEALKEFAVAEKSINNYSVVWRMADCYMYLNKSSEALKMLGLAFKRGVPISRIDKELFAPIWPEVEKAYAKECLNYYASIDTVLRNKLASMENLDQKGRREYSSHVKEFKRIDSINIKELKEICVEKGWPGKKQLGFGIIPDPATLVIHSDEKNNIYFLDLAMKASLNNEDGWFGTRAILINLMWRFNHDGFNKLRLTYLTADGKLDLKKSFFQLSSLAKFLNDNPDGSIELLAFDHPTNKVFSKSYQNNLLEVKQALIKYGLDSNRISINDKLRPPFSDEFGDFYFGFKR
jgi:tetratricopeptide (TPR) repeat protein